MDVADLPHVYPLADRQPDGRPRGSDVHRIYVSKCRVTWYGDGVLPSDSGLRYTNTLGCSDLLREIYFFPGPNVWTSRRRRANRGALSPIGSSSSDDASGGCPSKRMVATHHRTHASCMGSKPCLRRGRQDDGSDMGQSRHWARPVDAPVGRLHLVGVPLYERPMGGVAPFYWTSMACHTCGWTAIGGSFHWALSHLTPTCLFVSRLLRFPRDRRQPPAAVVGPFLAGSGGACTYAKPSGPCWRGALSTYRGLAWWA